MKISDKVIHTSTQVVYTIKNIIAKNDIIAQDIYVLADKKNNTIQVFDSTFSEEFTKK